MANALRDHVIENVWCSPEQDNQIILSPKRITKGGGDTVTTLVMTRRLALPVSKKYFHVYSVGQVTPALLGLLAMNPTWGTQGWLKMQDAVNNLPLFCDVYTDNGVRIPLEQVYYQYTNDRAFVFCVELRPGLDLDYDQDQVYFRLYTNAYYDTVEANTLTMNTRVISKTMLNNADILEVQGIESQWRNSGVGAVLSYINGQLVHNLTMVNVKVGDRVECIIDPSIKKVVDLKLADLKVFTSLRDEKQKYLIHYPGYESMFIDYADDIDVYVLSKREVGYHGRYLHRNLPTVMRMVTHRDYSLQVENVVSVKDSLEDWIESNGIAPGDIYIRLYIRSSGLFKTIPFENNRIHELYKLSDDDILNALIGANSTVPYWTAQNLENSDFVKLFDSKFVDLTPELIEKGYGYNAISKILADTPIYKNETDSGSENFTLPPGLVLNSTIYEYDENGVLLGWSHHDDGVTHIATNPACSYIEGIVGQGSHSPSVIFGTNNIPINPLYDYRVYMAYGQDTIATSPWRDVTDSDFYVIENNTLKWTSPDEDYILMVRSNESFLAYELELAPIAGTLYFTLSEITGGLHRELPVPMGTLSIWLNGRELIRGLDYSLDFPRVTIFNKDYLVQPAGSSMQKITIRFTDFALVIDGEFKVEPIDDYGFIEHGVLSNNNRYDIREDKVIAVTVKGCLKKASDVIFSERHQGVSIVNALNGQPYQVKERFIPFRGATPTRSEELRKKSRMIDKAVSDYMSVFLPQPERDGLSSIQQRHKLFSPFFSHLINDLESGQFNREQIQKKLTDGDVIQICDAYSYLLENDPLNEKFGIDYRFVLIHPHQLDTTILLDVESYAFLKHVVKLFGKNLITLSGHLNINIKE